MNYQICTDERRLTHRTSESGEVLAYPVETLRHWYVTPYGGTSPELGVYQIGIRREALEANTSLDPLVDRVRVSFVGRARSRPLILDRFFEIIALAEDRPDALARSPHGEVVFPEGDSVVRRYEPPQLGDDVLLNGVITRRLGVLPDSAAFAEILTAVFREMQGPPRGG